MGAHHRQKVSAFDDEVLKLLQRIGPATARELQDFYNHSGVIRTRNLGNFQVAMRLLQKERLVRLWRKGTGGHPSIYVAVRT